MSQNRKLAFSPAEQSTPEHEVLKTHLWNNRRHDTK